MGVVPPKRDDSAWVGSDVAASARSRFASQEKEPTVPESRRSRSKGAARGSRRRTACAARARLAPAWVERRVRENASVQIRMSEPSRGLQTSRSRPPRGSA